MGLTRKFLAALGIEEDKANEIINAHTEVVDALKNERDSYREDAEKYTAVQKELDELKANSGNDKFKVKYDALKEEYEQYKSDIEAKAAHATKTDAYKALLKEAGIAEKRIEAVLKVSDVDSIELDGDGKVKDADSLLTGIKNEWADFIPHENTGAKVDTGGSLQNQKGTMTVDEIMAIQDDAERQDAILENHELFGF